MQGCSRLCRHGSIVRVNQRAGQNQIAIEVQNVPAVQIVSNYFKLILGSSTFLKNELEIGVFRPVVCIVVLRHLSLRVQRKIKLH